MPGRALSNHAKKIKKRAAEDDQMAKAIAAYKAELRKPQISRKGLRPIAKEFHVCYTTLRNWAQGTRSATELAQSRRRLSLTEERVLVDLAVKSADFGFPLTHELLASYANSILKAREAENFKPVGKNWTDRFISNYQDELQTHWSKHLDTQRAKA